MLGDVTTSFEQGPAFPGTLVDNGVTATFGGGSAQTVGDFDLYQDGFFSYLVSGPGTTATIDFNSFGAESVRFFAVNAGNGSGTINVFGLDDTTQLTTATITADMMNDLDAEFNFNGLGAIGRIDITNAPNVNNPPYTTAIDSFTFSGSAAAVPEPATWGVFAVLFGIGVVVTFIRRRGKPSLATQKA